MSDTRWVIRANTARGITVTNGRACTTTVIRSDSGLPTVARLQIETAPSRFALWRQPPPAFMSGGW